MGAATRARFEALIRADAVLAEALEFAAALALPQWLIVSGSVYQSVWNALTWRSSGYGLKDVDLVYFDPDLSFAAEDAVIRRAAAAAPPRLAPLVEVRNQARAHLWFEKKFGEPYARLGSAEEALERYLAPAFAVGVRLGAEGALEVAAPFGLEDVFAMRLRRNPRRPVSEAHFQRALASCRARWPEVVAVGEDHTQGDGPWTMSTSAAPD